MKRTIMMAAVAFAVSLSAEEFKVNLDSPVPWKKITNYNNRLKIENGEVKGKKAVKVSFANKDANSDTAFVLIAPDYPVKDKKMITVSFQVLASDGLKNFGARNPRYVPGIRWFDADGQEIKPMTRFKLPAGNGEIQSFSQKCAVPPAAAVASLQIGFDNPNIAEGQIFAVADIQMSDFPRPQQ